MSPEQIVGLITGSTGVVGCLVIFITLIMTGKLHTDGEFTRVEEALRLEKEAHADTTAALVAASERADAAVRASELIAEAFSSASQRRRRSVQPPSTPKDPG